MVVLIGSCGLDSRNVFDSSAISVPLSLFMLFNRAKKSLFEAEMTVKQQVLRITKVP